MLTTVLSQNCLSNPMILSMNSNLTHNRDLLIEELHSIPTVQQSDYLF